MTKKKSYPPIEFRGGHYIPQLSNLQLRKPPPQLQIKQKKTPKNLQHFLTTFQWPAFPSDWHDSQNIMRWRMKMNVDFKKTRVVQRCWPGDCSKNSTAGNMTSLPLMSLPVFLQLPSQSLPSNKKKPCPKNYVLQFFQSEIDESLTRRLTVEQNQSQKQERKAFVLPF